MWRLSSDQGGDVVHKQTHIFCGSPLKRVWSSQPLLSPISMSNLQHLLRGETSKPLNCRMLPCHRRRNRLLVSVSCLKWWWRASYSGKQDAVVLSRFSEAYLSKTQVLLVLCGLLNVAWGFFLLWLTSAADRHHEHSQHCMLKEQCTEGNSWWFCSRHCVKDLQSQY